MVTIIIKDGKCVYFRHMSYYRQAISWLLANGYRQIDETRGDTYLHSSHPHLSATILRSSSSS